MKILFCVEFYYPSVGGAQEVIRQLAENMRFLGHDVFVATTLEPTRKSNVHNEVKIIEFSVAGNRVNGIEGEVERYQNFLISNSFDVILIYAAQQWTFDAAIDVLPKINAKKVFVPCGYSNLYVSAYKDYFSGLPLILNNFDAIVYHSLSYRDYLYGLNNGLESKAILIPNGADCLEFSVSKDSSFRSRMSIPEDALILLTVGSMTGAKGHLECALSFEQLDLRGKKACLMLNGNQLNKRIRGRLSVNCARAVIVHFKEYGLRSLFDRITQFLPSVLGLNPAASGKLSECVVRIARMPDRQVIICNLNRQDLIQAFLNADVFVFASHIEYSPLVLFEACASGLPFLTVPVGNAREIVSWTGGGVICEAHEDERGLVKVDPHKLAESISDLLWDRALLQKLSQSGLQSSMDRFNWAKLVTEYVTLFEQLCKASQ